MKGRPRVVRTGDSPPRRPDLRICPQCKREKNRRVFRGSVCIRCQDGPRCGWVSRQQAEQRRTNLTAAMLREMVAPSPEELEAVEECVRRMLAQEPTGLGGNNQPVTGAAPAGPEAAIDAVVEHWKRRTQLGSLAIQIVRERG